MKEITIIDYGMGNLRSVEKAFEKIGAKARVSGDPKRVKEAPAIVVPGVGSFDHAVEGLRQRGLFEAVIEAAHSGRPYLGICLGFQLLFERSEEGKRRGFGLLPGKVVRFRQGLKTPHMGWNRLNVSKSAPEGLWKGIPENPFFYFVHSYYVTCDRAEDVLCRTEYGDLFVSAVHRKNIIATQFHPEKSQHNGLRFLKNYMEMCACR